MGNIRVGQGGLSAELVNDARRILQSNGGRVTAEALQQLEQKAIQSGGAITETERTFLANLDNQ